MKGTTQKATGGLQEARVARVDVLTGYDVRDLFTRLSLDVNIDRTGRRDAAEVVVELSREDLRGLDFRDIYGTDKVSEYFRMQVCRVLHSAAGLSLIKFQPDGEYEAVRFLLVELARERKMEQTAVAKPR